MDDTKENASDTEDVPSDFFDDFNKDEFMEGLQVIDSWDDGDKKRRALRIDAAAVDGVADLRELIDRREEDTRRGDSLGAAWDHNSRERRSQERRNQERDDQRLDHYIKPGSRRDPTKTMEAIRRDKQVKVKEYLAKSLDATNELKPPGTELDDFFDDSKTAKAAPSFLEEELHSLKRRSKSKERHRSPTRYRKSHRWSPRRSPRWSPQRRSPRRSPVRMQRMRRWQSPSYKFRRGQGVRYSQPQRRSPQRRSPRRRFSPSPPPRRYARRSRSRSPSARDNFLYPRNPEYSQHFDIPEQYTPSPYTMNMPVMPGYSYAQPPEYHGGFPGPVDYNMDQPPPPAVDLPEIPSSYGQPTAVPQPVPAPALNPMNPTLPLNPLAAPPMVPAPKLSAPKTLPPVNPNPVKEITQPYDALAQLLAEGKISQQDYLKLAPTKASSPMDTNTRVMVLNRCNQALSKLGSLVLPNRLVMNNNMVGVEPKSLAPRFCSPLKRQGAVEFHFTKLSGAATAQQNKQLVDSIIGAIGLEKVVSRPKKKTTTMKDAAVQTSKPHCDVCEVREAVQVADCATAVDREHFSTAVHTQVIEQDLMSSKAVFAPSGSLADGATMSIAHMTPAQLVSQLAARAKTLKQSEPAPNNQYEYTRRNPQNYDNQQYHQHNNYNYRY